MRLLTIIYFVLSFEISFAQISRPTDYVPQDFDIISYDVSFDLMSTPLPLLEHGVCRIIVAWKEQSKGYLPIHLRDLTIDSVTVDGTITTYLQKGTLADDTMHHAITIGSNVKKGDTSIVLIYYHGMMGKEPPRTFSWGGVYATKRILYAIGTGFFANYVGTTQHWLPCYDHPSDKALLTTRIHVPKGLHAVSNGKLLQVDTTDTGLRYVWNADIPMATYLMTFAVDSFQRHVFGNPHNVVFAIKQDSLATAISFSQLPRMIATLERRFGAYPFSSVGYVLTPTGSMEHQTMISIDEAIVRKKDSTNSTILHELSHQWFGDNVTPQNYGHHWLSESFATFSETLWAEELKGQAGYIQDVQAKITEYFGTTVNREGVMQLEQYPRQAPSSNYPRTIYVKGAAVLAMLRHHLGDSVFFASLRTYLNRHTYGNAVTKDFQQACEDVSGLDLEWFFNQWVRRKGWPRIQVDTATIITNGQRSLRLNIIQVQPADYGFYVRVPIQIGFRLQDNSFVYRTIECSGPETTIFLDSLPPYRSMNVNQGMTFRSLVQVAKVTSIAESHEMNVHALYAYPNPGREVITIEYPIVGKGPVSWSIMDIKGNIIKEWKNQDIHIGTSMTALMQLDVSGFQPGTYVISMKQAAHTFSTTHIITK